MAFWSSEKLKQVGTDGKLIQPFDSSAIEHGAYELRLGPEAFLTSYEDGKKRILQEGEQLVIPPGQFGLLLTEETVSISPDAIGFISIKAGIKFRGLVNVSGFHVDPGFQGRLKFSVYNAGSRDVVLQRKQRVFLLWLSDLDRKTQDVYAGSHANQNEITPDDVMKIQGEIASPGQLKNDIRDLGDKLAKDMQALDHRVDKLNTMFRYLVGAALALVGFSLRGCFQTSDHYDVSKQVISAPGVATNAPTTPSPAKK
jgi:dCTP deaminase